MLWQQHHDGITGTSILSANDISCNEYYLANKAFGLELRAAVGAIASQMDTQTEGIPMVVYNPLSQERTDIVEADVDCEDNTAKECKGVSVKTVLAGALAVLMAVSTGVVMLALAGAAVLFMPMLGLLSFPFASVCIGA